MPLAIDKTYAQLNSPGAVPPYWSSSDLTEWAANALRAGGNTGWFHAIQSAMDDATISTQAVAAGGMFLRAATEAEIDALDPAREATGAATRVIIDARGYSYWPGSPVGTVQAWQCRAPQTSDALPEIYFVLARWGAIEAARSSETAGAMPDMVPVIKQFRAIIEGALKEMNS